MGRPKPTNKARPDFLARLTDPVGEATPASRLIYFQVYCDLRGHPRYPGAKIRWPPPPLPSLAETTDKCIVYDIEIACNRLLNDDIVQRDVSAAFAGDGQMQDDALLLKNLDERRRDLGLSYEQLSKRCGVSRPTVQRVLSGSHAAASFANIVAIADPWASVSAWIPRSMLAI